MRACTCFCTCACMQEREERERVLLKLRSHGWGKGRKFTDEGQFIHKSNWRRRRRSVGWARRSNSRCRGASSETPDRSPGRGQGYICVRCKPRDVVASYFRFFAVQKLQKYKMKDRKKRPAPSTKRCNCWRIYTSRACWRGNSTRTTSRRRSLQEIMFEISSRRRNFQSHKQSSTKLSAIHRRRFIPSSKITCVSLFVMIGFHFFCVDFTFFQESPDHNQSLQHDLHDSGNG